MKGKTGRDIPAQAAVAAAGGDYREQLRRLKAHLAFQSQERFGQARLSWNTVITKDQSRLHITRDLHRKINAKNGEQGSAGKLDSEDGQRSLASVASHARGGCFHGGCHVTLPWRLRYRMYRERRKHWPEDEFWEYVSERREIPLRKKEAEFPLEIQGKHALMRYARELVKRQGGNPKRHRDAVVVQGYRCPWTGDPVRQEEFSLGKSGGENLCNRCGKDRGKHRREDLAYAPAYTPGDPPEYIGATGRSKGRTPAQTQRLMEFAAENLS